MAHTHLTPTGTYTIQGATRAPWLNGRTFKVGTRQHNWHGRVNTLVELVDNRRVSWNAAGCICMRADVFYAIDNGQIAR